MLSLSAKDVLIKKQDVMECCGQGITKDANKYYHHWFINFEMMETCKLNVLHVRLWHRFPNNLGKEILLTTTTTDMMN